MDELRRFYDENDIRRHRYNGYFIYIVGNKPYIFMLSRESDYKGEMEIDVKCWNLSNGEVKLIEFNTLKVYNGFASNDTIILNVTLEKQKPYLFILDPYYGVITRIEKPKEKHLYFFDKEIIPFPKTVMIGKISILANAESPSGVSRVEFYVDDELKFVDSEYPYSWLWNEHAIGRHEIKVIAYDNQGNETGEEKEVLILNFGG